jgi:hypothetical protein
MTAYPDLPIPRCPTRGLSRIAREQLLLDSERRDRSWSRLPAGAVAGSAVVAVASLGLPSPWQHVVANGAAALGLFAGSSLLTRMAFERRQLEFERDWLTEQTAALRRYPFEVLSCTVSGREYSMASPAGVRDLRGQPGDERASLAFTYLADGRWPTIGEVHRRLRDVTFVADVATPGRAFVRFPQAQYLPRPRRDGRPARRTCWSLDGPVLLSVSDATAGTAAAAGA